MTSPSPHAAAAAMVAPFPAPGPLITQAYDDLRVAAFGTPEQRKRLGDPRRLARPWEPATCTVPELRLELWGWLEDVATWVNDQHTWDVSSGIPACWPRHPHLVHQLAVLADQRRNASEALTSNALEEWHRYGLPAFWDRLRTIMREHCDNGHEPCPAVPRRGRHTSSAPDRHHAFAADVQLVASDTCETPCRRTRFELVDTSSGELLEDPNPVDWV